MPLLFFSCCAFFSCERLSNESSPAAGPPGQQDCRTVRNAFGVHVPSCSSSSSCFSHYHSSSSSSGSSSFFAHARASAARTLCFLPPLSKHLASIGLATSASTSSARQHEAGNGVAYSTLRVGCSLSLSLSLMGKRHCFCARGARGSETNAWGSLFACTVAQTCSRQLVVCLMCALFLLIVCSLWHSSFAHARRRHSRFHRHLLLCYFGGLPRFANSCLCA